MLLTEGIKVLNVSNVHVPHRAGVDRERESQREQARVLASLDLQSMVVMGQSVEGSDLVEGHGGGRSSKVTNYQDRR